jgi:ribosomal protein S18 acetylase RimI-like enzyme
MLIRAIEEADIPAVVRLLRSLAQEFIVHESPACAASTFLRENDEQALCARLAQGFVYHVAVADGGLAGFIGMHERSHVFHLFVAREWQRQGVARRLWEVARGEALAGREDAHFTVNASNHAVGAYEALGFVRTAPMQCKNGIYFNPMEYGGSML